jgi:hypothetical protein
MGCAWGELKQGSPQCCWFLNSQKNTGVHKMITLFRKMILVLIALSVVSVVNAGDHPPSVGAKGMAGAKGTFEFKPDDWANGKTTWWKDDTGIAPGIAGCHIGVDAKGNPNGRMFGEACLPNGLLVETNPGAGVLHSHKGGIGHPDTFDCNVWCKDQGASKGSCSVMPAPPCEKSAMCACE